MSRLVVRDLTHRFGDNRVLLHIDLTVEDRQIVSIMGSSGGGKTTLLRCIAGLIQPTSGSIEIDGVDVSKNPDVIYDKVGLVFQSAALFDYLNVRENILFGVRRKRRLSRSEQGEIVRRLLHEVALPGVEKLMPGELSGGMRKRVGLARALALQPKVLLYDEPTSGLDPVTAYSIDQLIVETRDRLGVTSIVVSHDVSSVFRVSDRIAFLSSGTLAFIGTVEEFRQESNQTIVEMVDKAQAEKFD